MEPIAGCKSVALPFVQKRMRKTILVLCLIFSLVACTPSQGPLVVGPSEENTIVPSAEWQLPSGPPASVGFGLAWVETGSIDPMTEPNLFNRALIPLLYEGLFYTDSDFTTRKNICLDWEAVSEEQYRFQIRDDIVFSDGEILTADDVLRSFNKAKASKSLYSERLSDIASVSVDRGVLVVTLTEAHDRLEALLDFPIIRDASPQVLGTGPYVLSQDTDGIWILEPNIYYPVLAHPSRIDLLDTKDPSLVGFYFQYSHISLFGLDFLDPNMPGIHSGFEKYDFPSTTFEFIAINPTANLSSDLRQLFQVAMPRDKICKDDYSGNAEVALLPINPHSTLYPKIESSLTAQEILESTDWEDSDGDGILEQKIGRYRVPLSYSLAVCGENPNHIRAAETFAESLLELGIEIRIEDMSWTHYLQAISKRTTDLVWAQANLTLDWDLSVFLKQSSSLNIYSQPFPETMTTNQWLEQLPVISVCFHKNSLLSQRGLLAHPTPAWQNLFLGFTGWEIS
jgi:peptide/nickel transport system substrate-binding protein